jgi:hypothetical protein
LSIDFERKTKNGNYNEEFDQSEASPRLIVHGAPSRIVLIDTNDVTQALSRQGIGQVRISPD